MSQIDAGPATVWAQDDSLRDSAFLTECLTRLVVGRDANIIITAASETGVGKTTLAVTLAMMLDQHGWTADKAAVADAAEYDRLYDTVEPGSALILDEAEKAMDSRRGMTSESVELSQTFATKRYRQVFSILTAPSKSWIDKRLGSDAADFWIEALQTDSGRIKGEAKVYNLVSNEHYEVDYTKRIEFFAWPNLDGHEEFEKLDERKRALLEHRESESGAKYVKQDEVKKKINQATAEAKKSKRNKIINELGNVEALSQQQIASAVGLSKTRVNQILNSDGK